LGKKPTEGSIESGTRDESKAHDWNREGTITSKVCATSYLKSMQYFASHRVIV
jgi:hypothetical protein